MHLGKFHFAITKLNRDYIRGEVAPKLQSVIHQLDTLAANPGQPVYAVAFKEQLEILRNQLSSSKLNKPYPTLAALLDSINARKFVGDQLFQRVEDLLADNGMTPQLAATALRNLLAEMAEFFNEINAVDTAFTNLPVEYERLLPGEGEIGISIPEPEEQRLLITLAETAKAWDKALRPFVELADPEHNPIGVRTISSSDWQFYLTAAAGVYFTLSGAVSRLNELLQKLIETKKLLSQLLGMGVSESAIAGVVAESDGKLELETRKIAEEIVDENPPEDAGRANELKTALTASLKFITRQMAENVTIEVRYVPPEIPKADVPADQKNQDDSIARIAELTTMAEQIERNMEMVRLDAGARQILNLPAPDDEKD